MTCAARLVAYFVRFPHSYPHECLAPLPRGRLRLDCFRGGRCASAFQPARVFCSALLCRPHVPLDLRLVCRVFNSWDDPTPHQHVRLALAVRVQSLWQFLPTAFTLLLSPAYLPRLCLSRHQNKPGIHDSRAFNVPDLKIPAQHQARNL